jgi:hypothetical protein
VVPRQRVQILQAARVRLVVGFVLAPEQHQVPRRAPNWRKARHDHRRSAFLDKLLHRSCEVNKHTANTYLCGCRNHFDDLRSVRSDFVNASAREQHEPIVVPPELPDDEERLRKILLAS